MVVVDAGDDLPIESVREALGSAPGLELLDDPAAEEYPMPGNASEADEVQVGRVRAHGPRTVSFWVVSDNLRKGSALNAVQIAERIIEDELF
jgi:aspartate-semialdehyde dehydrogenase